MAGLLPPRVRDHLPAGLPGLRPTRSVPRRGAAAALSPRELRDVWLVFVGLGRAFTRDRDDVLDADGAPAVWAGDIWIRVCVRRRTGRPGRGHGGVLVPRPVYLCSEESVSRVLVADAGVARVGIRRRADVAGAHRHCYC